MHGISYILLVAAFLLELFAFFGSFRSPDPNARFWSWNFVAGGLACYFLSILLADVH
jgi:hypothetical protein